MNGLIYDPKVDSIRVFHGVSVSLQGLTSIFFEVN